MSATTNCKNAAIAATLPDQIALHSGFPGLVGANEISGGAPAYARVAPSFGSVSGASASTTAAMTFNVPAGTTVRWVTGLKGGVSFWVTPNGGSPKEFIADPALDLIRATGHGYIDTQKVVFWGGTVPGGLTEGAVYYVRDAAADTFKVAATSGGAAIDITSAGSGDCQMSFIAEDSYPTQDTHTLSNYSAGAPF